MILYNSENSIHDIRPYFAVRCFVTAVLWSMVHLSCSSQPVMRLLLKSPPLNLLAGSALALKINGTEWFPNVTQQTVTGFHARQQTVFFESAFDLCTFSSGLE